MFLTGAHGTVSKCSFLDNPDSKVILQWQVIKACKPSNLVQPYSAQLFYFKRTPTKQQNKTKNTLKNSSIAEVCFVGYTLLHSHPNERSCSTLSQSNVSVLRGHIAISTFLKPLWNTSCSSQPCSAGSSRLLTTLFSAPVAQAVSNVLPTDYSGKRNS